MNPPHLFVYGLLRKGCHNRYAAMLAAQADYVGTAHVPGRLFKVAHYPGLAPPANPSERVPGDVFRLRSPASTLALLDRFEGCRDDDPQAPYRRVKTRARLANGARVECWVYDWQGATAGLPRLREFRCR